MAKAQEAVVDSGWRKGPLPMGTYGWGGVVPTDHEGSGFFFADFCGDHVKVLRGHNWQRLLPDQVVMYCNDIAMPPNARSDAIRG